MTISTHETIQLGDYCIESYNIHINGQWRTRWGITSERGGVLRDHGWRDSKDAAIAVVRVLQARQVTA